MCAVANVSERTLIYAFKERYGLSPKAFLRARQVSQARRRFQMPSHQNERIADIAIDLGFGTMGILQPITGVILASLPPKPGPNRASDGGH